MIACCSDIFLTSSDENFLYRTSCERDGDMSKVRDKAKNIRVDKILFIS